MTDNIVKRLRRMAMRTTDSDDATVLYDAAKEIESLRAAGDALVAVMQAGSDAGWDAAIDAWQEARREG